MDIFKFLSQSINLLEQEDQQKVLDLLQTKLVPNNIQPDIPKVDNSEKDHLRKIKIAKEAIQCNNNSKVAEAYGICEGSVRNYIKLLSEEEKQQLKISKQKQVNRIPSFLLVEVKLVKWFIQKRSQKQSISQKDLCEQALILFNQEDKYKGQKFMASNGWFQRFKQRWKISVRQSTSSITNIGNKLFIQIGEFLQKLKEFRLQKIQENKRLIFVNIDEVPIYFDMTGKTTLEFKGKKNIEVINTRENNQRFTLVAGIMSSGVFLPPLFIFKSKTNIKLLNNNQNECILTSNTNGWQTSKLYEIYLQSVVANAKIEKDEEIVLIQDKFSGHFSENISKLCQENKIHVFTLPASSTGIMQPIDTSISKKLKSKIKDFQKKYISSQMAEENEKDYIKRPSFEDVVDWTLKGYQEFNKEEIQQSFVYCSLNMNLDKSQDSDINPRITNKTLYNNQINQYLQGILNENGEDYNLEDKQFIENQLPQNQTFEIDDDVQSFVQEKFESEISDDDLNLLTDIFEIEVNENLQSNKKTEESKNIEEKEENGNNDNQYSNEEFFKTINQKNLIIQKQKQKPSMIFSNYKESIQSFIFELEDLGIDNQKRKQGPKQKPLLVQSNTIDKYFAQKN